MSRLSAGIIAAATGYDQVHTLTCPRSVLSAAAHHLADECRAGRAPTTGSAGSRNSTRRGRCSATGSTTADTLAVSHCHLRLQRSRRPNRHAATRTPSVMSVALACCQSGYGPDHRAKPHGGGAVAVYIAKLRRLNQATAR
jgi:hypothetical protein